MEMLFFVMLGHISLFMDQFFLERDGKKIEELRKYVNIRSCYPRGASSRKKKTQAIFMFYHSVTNSNV